MVGKILCTYTLGVKVEDEEVKEVIGHSFIEKASKKEMISFVYDYFKKINEMTDIEQLEVKDLEFYEIRSFKK